MKSLEIFITVVGGQINEIYITGPDNTNIPVTVFDDLSIAEGERVKRGSWPIVQVNDPDLYTRLMECWLPEEVNDND